jgi:hypothetical protein
LDCIKIQSNFVFLRDFIKVDFVCSHYKIKHFLESLLFYEQALLTGFNLSLIKFILTLRNTPSLTDYRYISTLLKTTRKVRYEYIFPLQLELAIGTLSFFGDKHYCEILFSKMGKLPANTIGKTLHSMMVKNNIMLVP